MMKYRLKVFGKYARNEVGGLRSGWFGGLTVFENFKNTVRKRCVEQIYFLLLLKTLFVFKKFKNYLPRFLSFLSHKHSLHLLVVTITPKNK